MRRLEKLVAAAATVATLALASGCGEPAAVSEGPWPRQIVQAGSKDAIVARLGREPYASILAVIRERAARAYEEPDPAVWDHSTIGHNHEMAQANAVLAWLLGDEAAATKARDTLMRLPTDFDTNQTWDVNIRMPAVLMTGCYAYDLLRGTPWLSAAAAAEIRTRLTTVTSRFFACYVENGTVRQLLLGVSQNNHPIRTAAAIGTVALTFPDHPEAPAWASFAASELSYLMGPDGKYLQPDGGVSEGPFYYGFAFGPAVAFFIAMDNLAAIGAPEATRAFPRDCRNRQKADPWNVTEADCHEGEPFHFDNPLDGELLRATLDWSINLRLPGAGWRAPLGDAYFNGINGGVLLTSHGGAGQLLWDWQHTGEAEPGGVTKPEMAWGLDLTAHHLFHLDDSVTPTEPPWRNRFLPAAGNAVFRSGWDADARWLLLVAENGPARKTLHDHVDGTSFSLAAYGEYLLLDPGYYKPDEFDNALTADSDSHNTVRIDGEGAPDKGLLLEFGDADAFLEHTLDGNRLAYAEARQSYQETTIERAVVFVRQRYFVVADRLLPIGPSAETKVRPHFWRLGGWAGYDAGGVFEPFDCLSSDRCGAHWARAKAGVEVYLASTAAGLRVVEPEHEPLMPPHVEEFDRERTVRDHGVIDGLVEAASPWFLAVLAPYRTGAAEGEEDGPLAVARLDAGPDAAGWQIESAAGREIVWLREPDAASSLAIEGVGTVTTDAALTVLDAAGSFGLIARGTEASVAGKVVVQGDAQDDAILAE